MTPVSKKGSCIPVSAKDITVMTLHAHRRPPEIPALDKRSHAPRHMAELVIMSHCQLQPSFVGESHEALRLRFINGEGLLHIHMATTFQTECGNLKMALRRRRHVNNVRPRVAQESRQIVEIPFDRKSLVELLPSAAPGHRRQRFRTPRGAGSG